MSSSSSDPSAAPSPAVHPILSYATHDADGLPPYVPEAEAVISAGRSPKHTRKFFRRTEDAIRYYCKSMSRRHGAAELRGQCVSCAQPASDFAIQLRWTATAPYRFREVRLVSQSAKLFFTTLHPICLECYRQWRRRVVWVHRPMTVLRWTTITIVACWVLYIALEKITHNRAGAVENGLRIMFLAALISGVVLRMVWRRRLPMFLRKTMPRGVEFHSISDVLVRHGAELRSVSVPAPPARARDCAGPVRMPGHKHEHPPATNN